MLRCWRKSGADAAGVWRCAMYLRVVRLRSPVGGTDGFPWRSVLSQGFILEITVLQVDSSESMSAQAVGGA